jgi:hypothetical protein
MALARMILKEIGGRFQNAAGTINSNKNMYYGSKNNAPSDKLKGSGNMGGASNALSKDSLVGGAGQSGMGAGDASSGVDFSSIGEAASAMA